MTMKTFNDRQKRILTAVRQLCEKISHVDYLSGQLAEAHGVSITSISRAMKHDATESAIVEAIYGRGRRKRLKEEENQFICDAAFEFHNN